MECLTALLNKPKHGVGFTLEYGLRIEIVPKQKKAISDANQRG